jgi:hypothetical protein
MELIMLKKNLVLLLSLGFALPVFGMDTVDTKEDLFEGLEFLQEEPNAITHESHDSWELFPGIDQSAQDEDQAPQAMDTTEDVPENVKSVKAYIYAMLAVSNDSIDLFPAPDLDEEAPQSMDITKDIFMGLGSLDDDKIEPLAVTRSIWNEYPEINLKETEIPLNQDEFNTPKLVEPPVFKAPYKKRLKLVAYETL